MIEMFAVVTLFWSTSGGIWSNKTNWLTPAPICDWHGIVCNENAFVERILLSQNGMGGKLPPEIGLLQPRYTKERNLQSSANESALLTKGLIHFDVSENFIRSRIPSEIEYLVGMEKFYVSSNQFTGPIPLGISKWRNLKSADFSGNQLDGDISALCLAGLQNLTVDCEVFTCDCCTPICTVIWCKSVKTDS